VSVNEEAARLERVGYPARHPGQLMAVLEVVEDLAGHDQVEAAGQRLARQIERREADARQAATALRRPAQRHGRDVSGQELIHAGCQVDGEVALRAGELERPSRSAGR
jgi:hypothetical protein